MNGVFENKKVIVIGGSSGIGLATAQTLANSNARVTITGRDAEKLKAIQQTSNIQTQVVDSSDRTALDAFFKQTGSFDHLVITVSGSKGMGNFAELSLADLRAGFEGKFWPQLNTLQAALPYLNNSGSVTLITAISSVAQKPGTSGLAAINGALELMVPVLAQELKPLRINAVSPGVVDTPWWNFAPEAAKQQAFQQLTGNIPAGRVARAEEIADAIVFTLGNSYMTGTVIHCDGGFSC
ncbi:MULTISPECIES: SDR family oxidoreductase [Niastella]|uniref:SDR family oxidoreductase n=1 Tax=Niastella soli TaxID=2821487 RepID=A0ABS3YXR5_9BACT|nr:SDR family oxidoreductase [Niastella soli]MBO9202210.1 SDR family oxidoreductase [Niastella soli]